MKKLAIIFCLWLYAGLGILAQTDNTHTVRRGESFAIIAKRYGITEDELKKTNPGKTVCYVGLKLKLPQKAVNQSAVAQAPAAANPPSSASLVRANGGGQLDMTQGPQPAKKKKKAFWKGVGEFFSDMGDAVVAVASGLSETGLLDNTGKVGAAIGGTADIVNLTRGTQSNFLGEATRGEYGNEGESVEYNAESSTSSVQNTDLQGLRNRLSWVENRMKQIDKETTTLIENVKNNKKKISVAQYKATSRIKPKNGRDAVRNSSVQRIKASAKAIEKEQEPYLQKERRMKLSIERLHDERVKLHKEKISLKKRIEELESGDSSDNENSVASSSSGSKKSYEFYKSVYDRWERRAKANYESLTNLGTRTKKNGTDVGGTSGGSMSTSSYMGMQKALRDAQKEMRSTRTKASKDGYNIPQSNYETISVSY